MSPKRLRLYKVGEKEQLSIDGRVLGFVLLSLMARQGKEFCAGLRGGAWRGGGRRFEEP
jgi:hypothetical protein